MFEMSINTRKENFIDLHKLLERYNDLSEVEKDVLENCILEIFSIFDIDPRRYQFDFRFHKR